VTPHGGSRPPLYMRRGRVPGSPEGRAPASRIGHPMRRATLQPVLETDGGRSTAPGRASHDV